MLLWTWVVLVRLRKALTRTKRQRNMAVGECNNRKLEVDILKSTSRALEVRDQQGRGAPGVLPLRVVLAWHVCVCTCMYTYVCVDVVCPHHLSTPHNNTRTPAHPLAFAMLGRRGWRSWPEM